jgi:hypothetical protein
MDQPDVQPADLAFTMSVEIGTRGLRAPKLFAFFVEFILLPTRTARLRLRLRRADFAIRWLARRSVQGTRSLVEPIGIEPTTSCLQSTRSPN